MIVRKECIGLKINAKSPHNDCHFSLTISNDAENFELYKALQLDVFEKDIPPMVEVVDESIEIATEELKPKKKKIKE